MGFFDLEDPNLLLVVELRFEGDLLPVAFDMVLVLLVLLLLLLSPTNPPVPVPHSIVQDVQCNRRIKS